MTRTETKEQWSNIGYILGVLRREDKFTLWCMALKVIAQAAYPLWAVTIPMQIIRLLEMSVAPEALFWTLCRIAAITVLLQVFATWTDKRSEARIGLVRTGIFRIKMIDKLLRMEYSVYAHAEDRAVVDRAWYSAWSNNYGVEGSLRKGMLLIGYIITLVGMVGALWSFSPWMPAILLLFSLLDQRLIHRNSRLQLGYRQENMSLDSRMNYIHETLQDVSYGKEARITGMGQYLAGWHSALMEKKLSVFKKQRKEYLPADLGMLLLTIAREALIYGYLIYAVWQGQITISEFSLYFAASMRLSDLVVQVIRYYEAMLADTVSVGDMRKMMDLAEEETDSATEPQEQSWDGPVEFRGISYRYPNAQGFAVKGFNYTFTPGRNVAIVGENGSGKTTLVKLLCGLIAPSEGAILSSGQDMAQCVGGRRYRQFSVVFQDINQYALTLGENVAMQRTYDPEKVRGALETAGLDPESFPRGLDTMLRKDFDPEGVDLSGGQLQALAIARALYRTDSRMIIMDEPTAALDPIAESRLYDQLHSLTRGRTAVFISHRLASTRFCDEILVMRDGCLVETGTHSELLARKGYYYQLFEAQSEYYRAPAAQMEVEF